VWPDAGAGNYMKIGAGNTSLFAPFNGKIDDIHVYGRALSAAEVANLYTNP